MFRVLKNLWLAAVAVVILSAGQSARAFSLLGPSIGGDAYQLPTLFYNLLGEIGAPKNLGEGYRWNTPRLYYAVDANFLNYFGTEGLAAVDAAFAMFNNLSNVSSYSSDLSELPLNSSRINRRAEALGLLDLKSALMNNIIEQLGLANPDRFTWAIRTRTGPPAGGVCPINMLYNVIERNFDPVTFEPSSYVNGVLYTYTIVENCAPPNFADAVEVQVDPASEKNVAVSSFVDPFVLPAGLGKFFTGLSRDDVGGLRYLMASNRTYVEAVETNSPTLLVVTNNSLSLLVTSNLASLLAAAPTNNAAQLAALFPGIQILNTVQLGFSNVVTTNVVAFITNNPFGQPGNQTTAFTTNRTTNIVQVFRHTFGNVVTNKTYNLQKITILQTNVSSNPFGPPGSPPVTNIVSTNVFVNSPGGEFFIVPANQCGFSVVSTQLATVILTTNAITNIPGVTNAANVTSFTNHTLVVSVPTCVTNSVSLRQGIEKIRFYRQDFDSLLGQTWNPVTNTFSLTAISNNARVKQNFFRVANQPDFLITAVDSLLVIYNRTVPLRNIQNIGTGLSGPGILQPPITFTFNKVGPIFQSPAPNIPGNVGVFFLPPAFPFPYGEFSQALIYQWGSFDGRTNDPVVYPSGSSILALENSIFLQMTLTGPLTNGHVGRAYSAQLTAAGAQGPPFTWTVITTPLYPGTLPDGLNLDSSTGLISGVPTTSGTFDFVVQVSDTAGRVNQRTLSIDIDP